MHKEIARYHVSNPLTPVNPACILFSIYLGSWELWEPLGCLPMKQDHKQPSCVLSVPVIGPMPAGCPPEMCMVNEVIYDFPRREIFAKRTHMNRIIIPISQKWSVQERHVDFILCI